ncbi:MAG: hypothetical protein SCH71_00790 [Desulfobulbaceae bacterium]|nr:hypothetical protein [Desulfobulbaceae bacterium]
MEIGGCPDPFPAGGILSASIAWAPDAPSQTISPTLFPEVKDIQQGVRQGVGIGAEDKIQLFRSYKTSRKVSVPSMITGRRQ